MRSFYCCSVAQSCLTLCDPMDHSTPGFPVLHYLPEFVHSCPLSRWCHPTISSSVSPISSCPQSFAASQSFSRFQLPASLRNYSATSIISSCGNQSAHHTSAAPDLSPCSWAQPSCGSPSPPWHVVSLSLGCEHMWLTNCHWSHLSSVRYCCSTL